MIHLPVVYFICNELLPRLLQAVPHGLGQFGAAVSAMVVANVLCEKNVCV